MAFLEKINFKNKMLLMAVIPVAVIFALVTYLTVDRFQEYNNAKTSGEVIDVLNSLNGVVHELQKERGMSATHVASKGRVFKKELEGQRQLTDAAIKNAVAVYNPKTNKNMNEAFEEEVSRFYRDLNALKSMRQDVDSLSTTVPDLAKYYTGAINKALLSFDNLLNTLDSKKLVSETTAFLNFVYAKESAGLERAVGGGAIGAKGLTPKNP